MSSVACVIAAAAAGAAAIKRNWNKDKPKEEVKKRYQEVIVAVRYILSFEGYEAYKLNNDIAQISYASENIEPQPISYNKISIAPENRALIYYVRFNDSQIEKFSSLHKLERRAVEFMNKHPRLEANVAQTLQEVIKKRLDAGVELDVASKQTNHETQIDTEIIEMRFTDEELKLNNSYIIDYSEVY